MLDDSALAGMETQRLPGRPGGRPFTALLQDDDQQRDAALARLLAELAQPDVRVVRMGNSMRSRLMLEHILIQVTGPDGRTSQDDGARRIARTIAERQGRETRVVLLITQAETLHSKTLRLLQAMQPYFAENGAPTLQVVFVGRQAFRALLDGHGMTPLREALGFQAQAETMRPAAPGRVPAPEMVPNPGPLPTAQVVGEPVALANPPLEPGTLQEQAGRPGQAPMPPPRPGAAHAASGPALRRMRNLVLGLAVFAAMALAAYMGLHAMFYREVQARGVLNLPPAAEPPPPAAAPPVSLVPGPPAQDPQASTPAPGLVPPAEALPSDPGRSRNALPAARRSPDPPELSSPPPAAPPNPRVVIHVPAGSERAEAMSAHLRAGLGSRLGAVEARRVAGTPERPSIRYFHPGDEPVAHQVAAWMADAGLIWTLQDFSAFLPRPSRGTIEVWLPRS
jgi:hypothetical protein